MHRLIAPGPAPTTRRSHTPLRGQPVAYPQATHETSFILILLAALLTLTAGCGAPGRAGPDLSGLQTAAERSDFRATARHAEVVRLLDDLAAASPLARRASLGTSGEGRDLPMLILSDPPVATAAEARARAAEGALVVLAIGNIHAGEVDGKEALPMLAREILGEARPALLKDLVVILAPIYNADGNERVSKDHRPGQNGPEEGMGRRENAAGLDLNRDGVKAESAEMAGLLRAFNEWDPDLFIDTHTTNGSYHRYVLTYAGLKSPAGDEALLGYSRDRLLPAVAESFKRRTGWDSFWYGNFEGEFGDAQRGHSRWESFPAEGRFLTTYYGLRNRLSLLTEAYSYAPFKDRVLATKAFVRCTLEYAARHRREIRSLLAAADGRARRREVPEVAIRSKMVAREGTFTLLGYEEETVDGRSRSTGVPKDYAVELWDRFIPEKSVTVPEAYAIREDRARAGAVEALVAKLRQHGIEVQRLESGRRVSAEVYTVRSARPASRQFQGHVMVRVEVDSARREEVLPGGTWIIPMNQRLARLAVYLLEPESEDGLAVWNYLDPWLTVGGELPVVRVLDSTGGG